MWVHEKMVLKCKLLENIPLHVQKLYYRKGVYELDTLSSNLLLKLGFVRRILLIGFPKRMIESIRIISMFFYAHLPHFEKAKQATIGVIRGANAKLSHHRGLMLAYLVENEMPFVHHAIECQGCGYTFKNDKSFNGRT
jgi:hypothetical protein